MFLYSGTFNTHREELYDRVVDAGSDTDLWSIFFHVQSVDIYSLLQQLRRINVRAHKNTALQLLSDSGETSVKVCCQMPK